MPSAFYTAAGELNVVVSRFGKPALQVSELVALAARGLPHVRYVDVSALAALGSYFTDLTMVEVSEVFALVAVRSTAPERLTTRSWGFNLDQHQFYVLHLGEQGTVLYDVLTKEWCQFQTQGYTTWNMEFGVEWNGDIYAGSRDGPELWKLDTDAILDEGFRPIQHVATGGLPVEGRNTLRTGMFVLSATRQGVVDDVGTPFVQLSISDDGGETYKLREQIIIDGSKNTQDYSWRGLGVVKAPGRVYRIADEGGLVTIKGADQKIKGDKDA